ncbi:MAG: ATP-binding protein [Chitinophagales bacterium]|nr:ATP-binding protein [Chitinophagales bacterium]
MNLTQEYYSQILDLIYNNYKSTWEQAKPGHCIKLTGLPETQLLDLQGRIRRLNPKMDCFVVNDKKADDIRYISATKLIELRNNEHRALFALIPTNSHTAAEDSYGNATFQNIDLQEVDYQLLEGIKKQFPAELARQFKEIEEFLRIDPADTISKVLPYVLSVQKAGFTEASLGDNLFYLGLIPDHILCDDRQQMLSRLNYNTIITSRLVDFSQSIYERVDQLPIEKDSLQKDLIRFFQNETELDSRAKIVETIARSYPLLNFQYWKIPTPNTSEIKVTVEWIKDGSGNSLEDEQGDKILKIQDGKSGNIKIRISTTPPFNQLTDLDSFKISLIMADSNTVLSELTRFKKPGTNRQFTDKKVELYANSVEVGNYYFRVHALDKDGNILNTKDEFKDPKVQEAWQKEVKVKGEANADRSVFQYKLTCDSDTFHVEIDDEEVDEPAENRKAKLHNALEAYFKFRVDRFKRKEESEMPTVDHNESFWLESKQKKLLSTYFVKFNNRHHYQIICSRKLKLLQNIFLKAPRTLGHCTVTLNSNPAFESLQTARLEESLLSKFAPETFLTAREALFNAVLNHCEYQQGQGSFESFPWHEHRTLLDQYLEAYHDWASALRKRTEEHNNVSGAEAVELSRLFQAFTTLDFCFIQSKLPDGKTVDIALIHPLHPLRLFWFRLLMQLFGDWEEKTRTYEGHLTEWTAKLEGLFAGEWMPSNHPLVIPGGEKEYYIYAGELAFGWGMYAKSHIVETLNARQLVGYFRRLFNIDKSAFVDSDVNRKVIIRHLSHFITQHPYVDKLVINIFNGGEAFVFADALVELEKDSRFKEVNYEIRLFETKERIIPYGQGFKELINPEFNQSEEAEAFSQATTNRLFPKLRYSVNTVADFLGNFLTYGAHLSFLINPFSLGITLIREQIQKNAQFVNGLVTEPQVQISLTGNEPSWLHYIPLSPEFFPQESIAFQATDCLKITQQFTANILSTSTNSRSLPATKLVLRQSDNVLISKIHESSDWVVTLDRNLGPEIFDLPAKEVTKPFLLDYIPGEEISGISSFLTTYPTSEVLGLLSPHFQEFSINSDTKEGRNKIRILLEDLRAVSSSLILQLNSTQNKAFEVIGTTLAKRVLEKKGILKNAIIVPIDLHQSLFPNGKEENKSRADQLIVSIDLESRTLNVIVLEIKCRKVAQLNTLKEQIKGQVQNTTQVLQQQFDPAFAIVHDRLDRALKNYELRSILSFYAHRAQRFGYLPDSVNEGYQSFLDTLDHGFQVEFRQLGFIFDFGTDIPHRKEQVDAEFTCFVFGKSLINDILDEHADLDTNRLEKTELDPLVQYFDVNKTLTPFLKQFRDKVMIPTIEPSKLEVDIETSSEEHEISQESPFEREVTPDQIVGGHESLEPIVLIPTNQPIISNQEPPHFDVFIGTNKPSAQYGILGQTQYGRKIAIDLNETVTISLFGVQGGGKSYSIGSVMEMVLKPIGQVNYLPASMAGVIFHYSESMDYAPEFTSMKFPNPDLTEIQLLKQDYGAEPASIEDVLLLTPKDKLEERKAQYPSLNVQPILFNSNELDAKAWMFLLGALNNDSTYIRQIKSLMRQNRDALTIEGLRTSIENSTLLTNAQKSLALQRLTFAADYIDDQYILRDHLIPGRLIVVDLRDEYIMKDEALGLFVIMLNIFSSISEYGGKRFNKFIVFDEAHKYMDNRELSGKIVEAIREMRHKGVSILIASQDPPSLPNEIIELSSIVLTHKFNSPSWLKHIQKSISQLGVLTPADMSSLKTGEAFLWASKSTDSTITQRPSKIKIRPRVTQHGGGTIKATNSQDEL